MSSNSLQEAEIRTAQQVGQTDVRRRAWLTHAARPQRVVIFGDSKVHVLKSIIPKIRSEPISLVSLAEQAESITVYDTNDAQQSGSGKKLEQLIQAPLDIQFFKEVAPLAIFKKMRLVLWIGYSDVAVRKF